MKTIKTVAAVLCIIVLALPVFGEEDEVYGRKLLDIDESKVESVISSLESPAPGEMPSDEWLYYNGLRKLSKYQFDPVWSPDGQWIACTENVPYPGLWLIPVDGGDPVHIYSNILEYDGYYLNCGYIRIWGFTPDGEEIILTSQIIDETQGTEVSLTIIDGKFTGGYFLKNTVPIMLAVDIHTGDSRLIAENGIYGVYSPDGNYFAYTTMDRPAAESQSGSVFVQDTQTGDTWEMGEISLMDYCFSHDNSFIIYTENNQLNKIPVTGGTSEQITYPTDDEITHTHRYPKCSPDGEWILFSGNGGTIENTISDDTEERKNYTSAIQKLRAFNVLSGETIEFFPIEPAVSSVKASFSPDGSQFCYQYENKEQDNNYTVIYIKDFDLPSQKQEIQVSVEDESPAGFVLKGNYPNPFNPSTTIEFSLPEAGFADLAIYNLAGQKIRELLSGTMSEGIHSVVWNGCDDSGAAVSAGMYLTRLRMNDAVVTGRMMLVK